MIRIRRIAARVPLGRVYEVEYRPNGGTRDDGFYGATRMPTGYLESVLGLEQALAVVREADWQWRLGDRSQWAVEFDESTSRSETTAPSFSLGPLRARRLAPLSDGVGWLRLTAHIPIVALVVAAFVDGEVGYDAAAGANINLAGLPLLALGLPWSLLYIAALPWLYDARTAVWIAAAIGPAAANLLLHTVYRIARWRRLRTVLSEMT